jgi:hypothetical protein
VGFIKEIRFTTLAIQVCVRAEEWRERPNPVPAHEHLWLRISKKATDVSYGSLCRQQEVGADIILKMLTSGEGHARDTVRENHLDANVHVFPGSKVVASPHRAVALRASEEGTRKYEGPLGRLTSLNKALRGDPRKEHPVDIMDVAVLPATMVDQVLGHGNLGSVENGRLDVVRQSWDQTEARASSTLHTSFMSFQM